MSFLTYRLILSAGVGVGTLIALACGARRNLPRTDVFDAVLGAAVAGMAIGRVAYVALNWSYFQTHLLEAAQLWRGGLWAPAVVAGAILGAAVVAWQRRLDLRDVLDALAPAAAAVAVAAWLGCLQRGCAWGLELWPHQTLLWPLRVELPDLYGLVAPRLPVQIAGAAWSGVLLAVSLLVKRRGRGAIVAIAGRFRPAVERPKRLERFTNPGRLPCIRVCGLSGRSKAFSRFYRFEIPRAFPIWLLLHAVGDALLAFARGDLTPPAGGLAAVQIADVGLAAVGLMLLVKGRL